MALTPVNRQEEWYQQMINASTGNYLPTISQQDAGKVMTVENDGSWGVENVPSDLPAVSADDKDKVLTVNNSGVWVASNPIGGRFILTFTMDSDTQEWSTDKTFAECVAAWESEKTLYALDPAEGKCIPVGFVGLFENVVNYISFSSADAESHTVVTYTISEDGASYETSQFVV